MELSRAQDLKIDRVSTVDQVAQRLRAMIADGGLRPGERLPEVSLAQAFGVSRPTVRDAIRVLAVEGLLTHAVHRGAVVTTLAAADIADIYAIRRLLELSALERWERAPAERREALLDALRRCQAAADEEDYGRFTEHELELHAAIVGLLDSPRTDAFFARVLAELRLVYGLLSESDSSSGRPRALMRRYKRMLTALRRGRPTEAQAVLARHLDEYDARLQSIVDT